MVNVLQKGNLQQQCQQTGNRKLKMVLIGLETMGWSWLYVKNVLNIKQFKTKAMKTKTELQKQIEATLWLILMAIFGILTIVVTI